MIKPWKRFKYTEQKKQPYKNILYTPEYLTLCAQSLKDNCRRTKTREPCIFAAGGICAGNCTLLEVLPEAWAEERWQQIMKDKEKQK